MISKRSFQKTKKAEKMSIDRKINDIIITGKIHSRFKEHGENGIDIITYEFILPPGIIKEKKFDFYNLHVEMNEDDLDNIKKVKAIVHGNAPLISIVEAKNKPKYLGTIGFSGPSKGIRSAIFGYSEVSNIEKKAIESYNRLKK